MQGSRRFLLLTASALAAGLPLAGQAFTPAPPPVCAPVSAAVRTAALGERIAGHASWNDEQCAVIALIRRGPEAVPVAVRLLGKDDDTARPALQVLKALGPQAQSALPALVQRIRHPSAWLRAHADLLYEALAALGAGARPAIPLLIDKSRQDAYRDAALGALGKLGQYDAGRVVPHLTAMLDRRQAASRPGDDASVLFALAAIGRQARGALPASLAALERAKASGDSMLGLAALRALAAIAEPGESVPVLVGLLGNPVMADHAVTELANVGSPAASAVPFLIDRLERSRGDWYTRDAIVRTLAAIAPDSPVVQERLLLEATSHASDSAAYALANIGPLPPSFAPMLAAALASRPNDASLRIALGNAQRAR